MRRLSMIVAVGVSSLVSITGFSAAEASQVVTSQYSCSKGGFTGTIRLDYELRGISGIGRILEVSYKIDKGGNKGGNSANVDYYDNGNLPATEFYTGDYGIQDDQWQYLGGNYTRGGGSIGANFIFDKSYASDPSCHINISSS